MPDEVIGDKEVLKFGVIGCGGIGPTHCGAIVRTRGAALVAVADLLQERARSVAEKFDVPLVYDRDTTLLENPDIDVVCLCTPSGMHADGAVLALRAGKHVIAEKPMDVSLAACDRMIRVRQETGKLLTVISQHRFDTAAKIVKEAVDTGKLGRIVLANATVPWYRTQAYYDSGDWRGTWEMDGGGALMNQGVHTVDLLQWLVSGQGRVTQVFGQTRTAAHERIEVEDVAAATLTFAGGAIGNLSATTAAYDGFPVRIEIYGTEGSAVLEGDRLRFIRLSTGEAFQTEEAASHALSVARGGTASVREETVTRIGPAHSAPVGAVWGDAHQAQIEDFCQAIRTGGTPAIDGPAARIPVEIILSVYRSARSGFPVPLP
ncbi:MAG: Gfo/Idh/MocA family oxidoreductase [Capsulimonadales bacterium]|nr:Gfo/Idh/MocA family oxidoreductase [Capsulimonadales bacterium]